MGGHRGENRGIAIENKIETGDYKIIHHGKAPIVWNPLHGVERAGCWGLGAQGWGSPESITWS